MSSLMMRLWGSFSGTVEEPEEGLPDTPISSAVPNINPLHRGHHHGGKATLEAAQRETEPLTPPPPPPPPPQPATPAGSQTPPPPPAQARPLLVTKSAPAMALRPLSGLGPHSPFVPSAARKGPGLTLTPQVSANVLQEKKASASPVFLNTAVDFECGGGSRDAAGQEFINRQLHRRRTTERIVAEVLELENQRVAGLISETEFAASKRRAIETQRMRHAVEEANRAVAAAAASGSGTPLLSRRIVGVGVNTPGPSPSREKDAFAFQDELSDTDEDEEDDGGGVSAGGDSIAAGGGADGVAISGGNGNGSFVSGIAGGGGSRGARSRGGSGSGGADGEERIAVLVIPPALRPYGSKGDKVTLAAANFMPSPALTASPMTPATLATPAMLGPRRGSGGGAGGDFHHDGEAEAIAEESLVSPAGSVTTADGGGAGAGAVKAPKTKKVFDVGDLDDLTDESPARKRVPGGMRKLDDRKRDDVPDGNGRAQSPRVVGPPVMIPIKPWKDPDEANAVVSTAAPAASLGSGCKCTIQ